MSPVYSNVTLINNGTEGVALPTGNGMNRSVTLDSSGVNGAPFTPGGISVGSGFTLRLTPGTALKFYTAGNYQLYVGPGAALIAQGTASKPITFTTVLTSPVSNQWNDIFADTTSRLRLAYCDIGYGGNNFNNALFIRTSDAIVNNCRIHDTHGAGVFLQNDGITPVFQNVQIDHNGFAGTAVAIAYDGINKTPVFSNVTLSNNDIDAVHLGSGNSLIQSVTPDSNGVNGAPFIEAGNITVGGGFTLTLKPGTALKFYTGRQLPTGCRQRIYKDRAGNHIETDHLYHCINDAHIKPMEQHSCQCWLAPTLVEL